MSLLTAAIGALLDIGARNGYISPPLADHAQSGTALDLKLPAIEDPRIRHVMADAVALEVDSDSCDLVFCAEVPCRSEHGLLRAGQTDKSYGSGTPAANGAMASILRGHT